MSVGWRSISLTAAAQLGERQSHDVMFRQLLHHAARRRHRVAIDAFALRVPTPSPNPWGYSSCPPPEAGAFVWCATAGIGLPQRWLRPVAGGWFRCMGGSSASHRERASTRRASGAQRASGDQSLRAWGEANGARGRRLLAEWDGGEEFSPGADGGATVGTHHHQGKAPEEVFSRSRYKAWWRCAECDHRWAATVTARTRRTRPTGCPGCAGKVPTEKNNLWAFVRDSDGRFDHLITEWHHPEKKLEDFTPRSHHIVPWRCSAGHVWNAKIQNRTSSGTNPTGCRKCNPGGRPAKRRAAHPEEF